MSAKDILLRPIPAAEASALIKRIHYSGKVTQNAQLHIGVFYKGALEGALQFGPSLDKKRLVGLVEGTPWNGFLELNRMAFGPALPRNSESRAIAIALRLIRKHAPHVKWVISFADGTQCGDGTIYRAAGFLLTGITRNKTIWRMGAEIFTDIGFKTSPEVRARVIRAAAAMGQTLTSTGSNGMGHVRAAGASPLPGFQLRYLAFVDPAWRDRLAVPILPYSAIDDAGARMYLGVPNANEGLTVARRDPPGGGGASPTRSLQPSSKKAAAHGAK